MKQANRVLRVSEGSEFRNENNNSVRMKQANRVLRVSEGSEGARAERATARGSRRSGARRRRYDCLLCGHFHSQQSRAYLEHLRDVHNKNIHIFQCDKCTYACPNRCKLLRHRNTVHGECEPLLLSEVLPECRPASRASEASSRESSSGASKPTSGVTHASGEGTLARETALGEDSTATLSIAERQNVFVKVQSMFHGTSENAAFSDISMLNVPNDAHNTSNDANGIGDEVARASIDDDDVMTNGLRDECTSSDINSNVLDLSKKTTEIPSSVQNCLENDDERYLVFISKMSTGLSNNPSAVHGSVRVDLMLQAENPIAQVQSLASQTKHEADNAYNDDREVEAITRAAQQLEQTRTKADPQDDIQWNATPLSRPPAQGQGVPISGIAEAMNHSVLIDKPRVYSEAERKYYETSAAAAMNLDVSVIREMSLNQEIKELSAPQNLYNFKAVTDPYCPISTNSENCEPIEAMSRMQKSLDVKLRNIFLKSSLLDKRDIPPKKCSSRRERGSCLASQSKQRHLSDSSTAYSASADFTASPPRVLSEANLNTTHADSIYTLLSDKKQKYICDTSSSMSENNQDLNQRSPTEHLQVSRKDVNVKVEPEMSCESAYNYIKTMPSHVGDGSALYGCRLCRYSARHKWKVAHHVRHSHLRQDAFYKCAQCAFVCRRKTEWTVHRVRHSAKKVHACSECGYQTVMKRNLVRHRVHHSVQRAAKCRYCSYSSSGEAAIQRHMSEFHSSPEQEKERQQAQMAYERAAHALATHSQVTSPVNSPPTLPYDVNANVHAYNKAIYGAEGQTRAVFQTPEVADSAFPSQQELRRSLTPTNSAPMCGSVSDSSTSSRHSVGKSMLACAECGVLCRGKSALRSHMITHSDETPWSCQLCPLRYKRKADLGSHTKNKHQLVLPPDYQPNQPLPGASDKSIINQIQSTPNTMQSNQNRREEQPLNLSIKYIASDTTNLRDGFGQFDGFNDFEDESELDANAREGGDNQPLDLSNKFISGHIFGQGNLKCSHCSYIAKWPADLRRHKLVHAIQRRFQCGICNKKFKFQFDLNTHLRRVHKQLIPRIRMSKFSHQRVTNPPVRNDLADQTAPRSEDIAMRSSTHKLKCTHCDFSTRYKGEMERHMSVHTGQKPWACLFCEYSTHWKGDMKRHLEKHHGAALGTYGDVQHVLRQTYCLLSCDGSAAVNTTLTSGEQGATSLDSLGEPEVKQKLLPDGTRKMIIKCPMCPYENEDSSKVKFHMEIHVNLKRFMCPECGKRSNWVWDVRKHVAEEHAACRHRDVVQLSVEEARDTLNSYVRHGPSAPRVDAEIGSHVVIRGTLSACPASAPRPHLNPATPSPRAAAQSRTRTPMLPGTPSPSEKLRPFKCSECGRRSNWRWDLNKHIRLRHPHAELITLTEEEARSTIHEVSERQQSRWWKASGAPVGSSEAPVCSEAPESAALSEEAEPSSPPHLTPLKPHHAPTTTALSSPPKLDLQTGGEAVPRVPRAAPAPTQFNTRRHHPQYIKKLVAGKFRPFKCSLCGKRSNWKWDVSKHMRLNHPGQAGEVISLTEDEAKSTYHEVEIARLRLKLSRDQHAVQRLERGLNTSEQRKVPSDLKVIKRFQCSVCDYRSNFKSDISRHLGRQHSVVSAAHVITLEPHVARDTLRQYNATHATRARNARHVHAPLSGVELAEALTQAASMQQDAREDSSGRVSPSGTDLASHVSSDGSSRSTSSHSATPVKKDIYLCKKCNFYTTAQKAMIGHYRVHGEQGIYRCTICSERSDYKHSISRHVQNRHDIVPPHEVDKYITQRDVYTIIHGDPAELSLVSNDVTSDDVSGAPALHGACDVETRPPDEASGDGAAPQGFLVTMYKCKICGPMRSSDLRYSVIRHVRRVHSEVAKPEECVLEFETLKPALSPEKIMHSNAANNLKGEISKEEEPGESPLRAHGSELTAEQKFAVYMAKRHRCKLCPFRTMKLSHLKMHLTNHDDSLAQGKFMCQFCNYHATQAHSIRSHEQLHVRANKFYRDGASPSTNPSSTSPNTFNGAGSYMHLTNGRQTPDKFKTPAGVKSHLFKTPTKNANGKSAVKLPKYSCDRCPFMSNKKNEFLYHKQFHRYKKSAQHKCELCPYWIKDARALKIHMQVHEPEYVQKQVAPRERARDHMLLVASPCKSDISDMSVDDMIESAELKQRIIASKVKSVAVTPHKVRTDMPSLQRSGADVMPSPVLDSQLSSLAPGSYKKFYKCRHCPWTNVRHRNLVLHEKMHGKRDSGRELFKCQYCDYYVGNRGLLSHHVKVHSEQYRPGVDMIDDVEAEEGGALEAQSGGGSESEEERPDEGVLYTLDQEETQNRMVQHKNSARLDVASLPRQTDYYIKYSEGRHILERAVLKKWCCEKCPYATIKKSQFEKHVSLHGSRQKYTCQYCDYSVPGYHLLLQHEKLHRMPNPNLLSVQSISNLTQLPDMPADMAASTHYASEHHALHDHLAALYEHTAAFTQPKPLYHCDRCPYSNTRRHHLLAHLKFHLMRSTFKCTYCDYSVSKSHLLAQHLRVHFILPGSDMSSEPPPEMNEQTPSKAADSDGVTIDTDVPEPIATSEEEPLDFSRKEKQVESGISAAQHNGRMVAAKAQLNKELDDYIDGIKRLAEHGDIQAASINNNNEPGHERATEKMSKGAIPPESGLEKETAWVCRYCDRAMLSSSRLVQHEQQHLVGAIRIVN